MCRDIHTGLVANVTARTRGRASHQHRDTAALRSNIDETFITADVRILIDGAAGGDLYAAGGAADTGIDVDILAGTTGDQCDISAAHRSNAGGADGDLIVLGHHADTAGAGSTVLNQSGNCKEPAGAQLRDLDITRRTAVLCIQRTDRNIKIVSVPDAGGGAQSGDIGNEIGRLTGEYVGNCVSCCDHGVIGAGIHRAEFDTAVGRDQSNVVGAATRVRGINQRGSDRAGGVYRDQPVIGPERRQGDRIVFDQGQRPGAGDITGDGTDGRVEGDAGCGGRSQDRGGHALDTDGSLCNSAGRGGQGDGRAGCDAAGVELNVRCRQ